MSKDGRETDLFRSVGGIPMMTAWESGSSAPWYFGWIPRQSSVDAYINERTLACFSDCAADLSGSGKGKTVLLYEAVRRVWGRDLDIGPQKIGDCVSWGYAGCIDLLACLEIISGEQEQHNWRLRAATEAIYGLSRVEYGEFDGSYQDGSRGIWAANAVTHGGTIPRELVGEYDPQRAKQWGARGLPDDLEQDAAKHRVLTATLIDSFETARDAITNGYPIAVCSDQGFSMSRDAQGFASPEGQWLHCMKFIASRDDERPGLLCMNSWGDTVTGPKGMHDIPAGSFWVDAEVCTRMFRSWSDSFALSFFDGYPMREDQLRSLVY